MRNADIILEIHSKRGPEGLPLERVYKHLYGPELFLRAYGKIYRTHGATTKGITEETVDGMSLRKIQGIIDLLKQEKYRWTPVRRTEFPANPLSIPSQPEVVNRTRTLRCNASDVVRPVTDRDGAQVHVC
jgi:hypothetical protein